MTSVTQTKRWLTAGVALLVVGGIFALTAVPSLAGQSSLTSKCPHAAKTCTCPPASKSCHCPPGFPRTQDYCEFCNPGSQYDPRTKTCQAVQAERACRNPRSRRIIHYHGSRKPLLCFRPPRAITKAERHDRRHSAEFRGVVVDPHHFKTRWYFLWGRCPNLNHRTKAGIVHKRTNVSLTLRHLHPGTLYCFRLVAANKRGKAVGGIKRSRLPIARRPKKPHGFTG